MEEKAFEVSGVFGEKVAEKLPISELEDWLNRHFTLIQYGPGVQYIFLLFVTVQESEGPRLDDIMYDAEESLLQLSLGISYEQVLQSTPDEVRFLMLEAFMQAMEQPVPELHIENFDRAAFLADLRAALS